MGSARDASAEPAAGSRCPARAPQHAQTPPASPPPAGICPKQLPRSRPPKAQRTQGVPPMGWQPIPSPHQGGRGKQENTYLDRSNLLPPACSGLCKRCVCK